MNKQGLIFGLAAIGLISAFVIGSRVYQQQRASELGSIAQRSFSTFVRPHSQVMGSPEAKVTIVEFTDPACETCAMFSPLVKGLLAANPGKLKLVVRYAPFHDGSEGVVRMLHASARQSKFWETLEAMYAGQPEWASHHQPRPEVLWGVVSGVGVDAERLSRDVQDPEVAKAVAQDLADAQTLGVTKTPGFFVNGKPLVTFGDQQLVQLVQAELAAAYPK